MCSGVCSDVQIDPANCGMCDNACSMGALCTKGLCQLTCDGLIACTNACMGDGPCYTACMKRATMMGRNLWDALGNCVNNACPGNNFGDPCYTPTSALCMKCWQTAQNKGGACAQALTDCHSDV